MSCLGDHYHQYTSQCVFLWGVRLLVPTDQSLYFPWVGGHYSINTSVNVLPGGGGGHWVLSFITIIFRNFQCTSFVYYSCTQFTKAISWIYVWCNPIAMLLNISDTHDPVQHNLIVCILWFWCNLILLNIIYNSTLDIIHQSMWFSDWATNVNMLVTVLPWGGVASIHQSI